MRTTKCRKCGQEIYFEKTKAGKFMPKNVEDNEPHWATCSHADSFRKKEEKSPYKENECSHNNVYYNAKTDITKCKICGKVYNEDTLEWVEDNEPHWATCSHADSFRKKEEKSPYKENECSHNNVYYNAKTDITKCKICGKVYNEDTLEWDDDSSRVF